MNRISEAINRYQRNQTKKQISKTFWHIVADFIVFPLAILGVIALALLTPCLFPFYLIIWAYLKRGKND